MVFCSEQMSERKSSAICQLNDLEFIVGYFTHLIELLVLTLMANISTTIINSHALREHTFLIPQFEKN